MMTFEEAETAIAKARAYVESQAMDTRAAGRVDHRTEEGLAMIFAVELILADLRDAPHELQEMMIEKIVRGLADLDPTAGAVQH